jgi:N-acetylmuramoyl-L-alanine amidase
MRFAPLLILLAACAGAPAPGTRLERRGDEIVVCGQLFHTGTPVVLWTDPGGYDAYRVEKRFAKFEESSWEKTKGLDSPNRYGLRLNGLTPEQVERVRGGGWDLATLQQVVDQFVLHYDVAGTSRTCFKVLHDLRGLSVHFMLDVDGTIYQTLDLKESAWHATISNQRSIGIEIANMGAYAEGEKDPFEKWYEKDGDGYRLKVPDGHLRTPGYVGRPVRFVTGTIQGRNLRQFDLTPEQYDSLIKLTAALCRIFPKLKCDAPRDAQGNIVPHKLADEEWKNYQGILGHYHVQKNKVDPGPAFDWDRLLNGARALLGR